MIQMNEIQIGMDEEYYFLQEIQGLGCRQFFLKFYYILEIMKLGDNFAEVAHHLFYGLYNIWLVPVVWNSPSL